MENVQKVPTNSGGMAAMVSGCFLQLFPSTHPWIFITYHPLCHHCITILVGSIVWISLKFRFNQSHLKDVDKNETRVPFNQSIEQIVAWHYKTLEVSGLLWFFCRYHGTAMQQHEWTEVFFNGKKKCAKMSSGQPLQRILIGRIYCWLVV